MPQEYILKGVVNAALGQENGSVCLQAYVAYLPEYKINSFPNHWFLMNMCIQNMFFNCMHNYNMSLSVFEMMNCEKVCILYSDKCGPFLLKLVLFLLICYCFDKQIAFFTQWNVFSPALWPTQIFIQSVVGTVFARPKWVWHEADHLLQYHAKVNNAWNCTSTLPYAIMAWCMFKHRINFFFSPLLFY